MKKLFLSFLLASALLIGSTAITEARMSSVKGYFKSNGTYVAPHYRTSPDSSRFNNWSTQGNYNPYTGKKGYTSPYKW